VPEPAPRPGPKGVFNVVVTEADRVKKVVDMVEKTSVEDVQSDLVATGRYSVDPAIFDVLRRIELGARGELQFAGAINLLFYEGYSVHVAVHDGIRPELGNPAGFIPVREIRPPIPRRRDLLLLRIRGSPREVSG